MGLFCFGVSHLMSSLPLLERMSFSSGDMAAFLAKWRSRIDADGVFGISTCNRTEFYASAQRVAPAFSALVGLVSETRGIDLRTCQTETFFFTETAAARHLLRLACGLESLVIGENEIMGQVRKARETALEANILGLQLDSLILRALDAGATARQLTGISRGNVSVASVGATLAAHHLGLLSGKNGVILGAGETAEAAARQLADRGMTDLIIANRTYAKAAILAHDLGGRIAAIEELETSLPGADLVVCAVGAPHFVVTEPMVRAALRSRPDRPMVLLDLSVPRNIDPDISSVPGAHLFSIADLTALAEENRRQRQASAAQVEQFIENEMVEMARTDSRRESADFIATLHRRVETIRQGHLKRYGHYFDDEHRRHLDTFTSGFARSLLHELVTNLQSIDLESEEGRRRFQLLQEMFNITPDDGGD